MLIALPVLGAFGALFGLGFGLGFRNQSGVLVGLGLAVMVALLAVAMFVGAVQCFGPGEGLTGAICSTALAGVAPLQLVTLGFPVAGAVALLVFWRIRVLLAPGR